MSWWTNVNRIDFDEDPWLERLWSFRICMPFFPLAWVGQFVSLKGTLHRGEGNKDAILSQEFLQHFSAPFVSCPIFKDCIYDLWSEFIRMMMRSRRKRGYHSSSIRRCFLHPLYDRTVGESKVARDLCGCPSRSHEPHCLTPHLRHVGVV